MRLFFSTSLCFNDPSKRGENPAGMKEFIRTLSRRCGYEITRYSPATDHTARLLRCLKIGQVETVIDVGANVGQFACGLRRAGYRGQIISIEPQREAHAVLVSEAAKDPLNNWQVLPRMALGESQATLDLHIAGNSWSTSLLPMLDAHVNALPSSREVRVEKIPVHRLDEAIQAAGLQTASSMLLKLDVQGYESQVLRGATGVLHATRAILTEMSLAPLYEGQVMWRELCDQIMSYGFDLFDIQPGFADPATGRLLQVDGLFARRH